MDRFLLLALATKPSDMGFHIWFKKKRKLNEKYSVYENENFWAPSDTRSGLIEKAEVVGCYKQKIKRIRELHAMWDPVPPTLILSVCCLVFAGLAFLLIMCDIEKRKSQEKRSEIWLQTTLVQAIVYVLLLLNESPDRI